MVVAKLLGMGQQRGERVELPPRARDEAIGRYVAEYAARLEYYCREAPLQWFNFYDFWHEPVR